MSIATSINIGASPERVWAILTDFTGYEQWNPFVIRARGEPRLGAKLDLLIQPPGRAPQRFQPIVIVCEPPTLFVWRGELPVPGLFRGDHRYALTATAAGGIRFDHTETFSGLMTGMLGGTIEAARRGFEAMNAALKARAEIG